MFPLREYIQKISISQIKNLLLLMYNHTKKGVYMFEKLKENIINYIYNISKQPVKLNVLLQANILFNEGMKLDGTKLGFRLRSARAYLLFLVLIHLIIIPTSYIIHELFAALDCHASIIIAVIFTAFLFGIFNYFKEWTNDAVSKMRIKQMWSLHFPHFPYDEFHLEVSNIFEKAKNEDIKHVDLERYILDHLSA